jgi:hypothetical protein
MGTTARETENQAATKPGTYFSRVLSFLILHSDHKRYLSLPSQYLAKDATIQLRPYELPVNRGVIGLRVQLEYQHQYIYSS